MKFKVILLLLVGLLCVSCAKDNNEKKTDTETETKDVEATDKTSKKSKNKDKIVSKESNKENKVTISRAKLSKENELFYSIGQNSGNSITSELFQLNIEPESVSKKFQVLLLKSNKDMSGWEEQGSFNFEASNNGLLNVSRTDTLPYMLNLKYADISGNNIGTEMQLDIKEMSSSMGVSLGQDEVIELNSKNQMIIYDFIISDDNEMTVSSAGILEDRKPTNINEYLIVIKIEN